MVHQECIYRKRQSRHWARTLEYKRERDQGTERLCVLRYYTNFPDNVSHFYAARHIGVQTTKDSNTHLFTVHIVQRKHSRLVNPSWGKSNLFHFQWGFYFQCFNSPLNCGWALNRMLDTWKKTIWSKVPKPLNSSIHVCICHVLFKGIKAEVRRYNNEFLRRNGYAVGVGFSTRRQ